MAYKRGKTWWYSFTDENGIRHQCAGTGDKRETERLESAAKLRVTRIHAGLIDPREARASEASSRPLAEHARDWSHHLAASGTARHAAESLARVSRAAAELGWRVFADIRPDEAHRWLAALPGSPATRCAYRRALRGFTRWCVKHGRLLADPLRDLDPIRRKDGDATRPRRALVLDELRRLLACTRVGTTHHGLTGVQRSLVYHVAIATGFRVSELRALFRSSSWWESGLAVLPGTATKNGREARTVLPPDLLAALRAAAVPLWLPSNPPEMLRRDLDAAGIPYRDESGKVFDFHALRGQYATLLSDAGIPLVTAQRLMRHSTPTLTAGYTRPDDSAGARAAGLLPRLTADDLSCSPSATISLHHHEATLGEPYEQTDIGSVGPCLALASSVLAPSAVSADGALPCADTAHRGESRGEALDSCTDDQQQDGCAGASATLALQELIDSWKVLEAPARQALLAFGRFLAHRAGGGGPNP